MRRGEDSLHDGSEGHDGDMKVGLVPLSLLLLALRYERINCDLFSSSCVDSFTLSKRSCRHPMNCSWTKTLRADAEKGSAFRLFLKEASEKS